MIRDPITDAPTSSVQRMAWILVVVYTNVVGLVSYILACRGRFAGAHDTSTALGHRPMEEVGSAVAPDSGPRPALERADLATSGRHT